MPERMYPAAFHADILDLAGTVPVRLSRRASMMAAHACDLAAAMARDAGDSRLLLELAATLRRAARTLPEHPHAERSR